MDLPRALAERDRVRVAVVALAAVALLARLVGLGDRIAHWDEGRVGYEILRYMATGAWEYRPIVHGPFLPQVNKHVLALLGPSDFTARLVVAVIGGLLPLVALLYRERLRDGETVAFAAFLAIDPILLYYSRFMRNDVLVAGFVLAALGFAIRLIDTGRARHLYAATGLFALALTAKENALVYPLALGGAAVLLLDHRLFLARERSPGWTETARRHLLGAARGVWRFRYPITVAALEFLVIIVFFYAPRAGETAGVGLWRAFAQPSMLPRVVEAATIGAGSDLVDLWVGGTHQDHAYLPFLAHYVRVLGSASGSIAVLAVLGFVADRYAGDRPRDLVALASYWGFVSVLGYPIAVDIKSAWAVSHAVVPLMIPAAVGAVLFFDWGVDALDADDLVAAALAALVLVLIVGQLAVTGVSTSYVHPQTNEKNVLVQYAQPEGELRPALRAIRRASEGNEAIDVVWYGPHYNMTDEGDAYTLPAGGNWYNRLPIPWYLEMYGATVNSTGYDDQVVKWVEDQRPPVVITRRQDRAVLDRRIPTYRACSYQVRQAGENYGGEVMVFYFDEPHAPEC